MLDILITKLIIIFGDCYFKYKFKNKCGAFKADNNYIASRVFTMNEFLNTRDYSSIYIFTAWN